MNTRIECWCRTCEAYVTVEEIEADFHHGHDFGPEDLAALLAVKEYLRQERKQAAKADPWS